MQENLGKKQTNNFEKNWKKIQKNCGKNWEKISDFFIKICGNDQFCVSV